MNSASVIRFFENNCFTSIDYSCGKLKPRRLSMESDQAVCFADIFKAKNLFVYCIDNEWNDYLDVSKFCYKGGKCYKNT